MHYKGLGYKQRRHAHSKWTRPLRFLSQVDFESSVQKTKHSRVIFVIFDTFKYNKRNVVSFMIRAFSASNHQLLNSNLRSLALSQRQTRLNSSVHYNQSQTILLIL